MCSRGPFTRVLVLMSALCTVFVFQPPAAQTICTRLSLPDRLYQASPLSCFKHENGSAFSYCRLPWFVDGCWRQYACCSGVSAEKVVSAGRIGRMLAALN